jgi:hypothetical protein
VLANEDLRDLLVTIANELADPEEELLPPGEGHGAPGGERLARGLDRSVDLLGRRKVDLAGLLARRGVPDRAAAAGFARNSLSADPVADARDPFARLLGCLCKLRHRASSALPPA